MIKNIVTDISILSKPCKKVENIIEISNIIKDLDDTLNTHSNGVGLAANQIGYDKRIAIVRIHGYFLNLINPSIINKENKIYFTEGCLSFKEKSVKTIRYNNISIVNSGMIFNYSGDIAVVIQHEIDHLDGITMFDRQE